MERIADAMARYADGDPAGFHEVYEALAPVVIRCMRRWIADGALAEDLVQETFLRVHRARDRYRTGAPVGPWVLTIARRLAIDALRRRGAARDVLTSEGRLPEPGEAPPEPEEDEALIAEVRAAVADLPESLRVVVAMHKLDEVPLAEVAAALGLREGAVRVRAHRGYKRLRDALEGWFRREAP
ncbi:MAG: sigma-70 family RNA polymerase sigma factor [Myxococcales bacterium]|nr:sigma-70 family RNA polymerase sigma factor [Myxococcales bacterium]